MKRLIILLPIILICALIITGCSTTQTPTTPAATTPAVTTSTSTAPVATAQPATKPATSAPATTPATKPAATTPSASTSTSNKYGGILRIAAASGPSGPFGAPWENSLSPITTQELSIETLLKEQVDGSMTPYLATSYEVNDSQDKPSITFNLRKGVKFSDGTDFNAQAVKFNLDQWVASKMAIGTTQYFKSIEIVDDYTLRINLTVWRNYILRGFGGDGSSFVVSPTAFQKNGIEWLRFNMVTTGPFIQKDFQRDVSMSLTRNPNYWNTGRPYLDGVQQVYVVDDMTRSALFKSGGADMIDCNNNNRLASELQAAGYQVLVQSNAGFFSLVPDSLNADSPWSNIKVRLAAEYAIDKDGLVKAFGYSYYQTANQYYPQGSPAYDSRLALRKYDQAKARQLLAEAGYPNGFKTTMTVAVNANRDIAVAMQAQLAAVGIQCDVQYPQIGAWIQQVTGSWKNGVQFMTQAFWPNPNANWNFFVSEPPNWFKSLKHPDGWKDMLLASFVTKNPDPAAMQKLEDALYNDETFIPLFYNTSTYATTDKVHDTGYGGRGLPMWWNVDDTWLSK